MQKKIITTLLLTLFSMLEIYAVEYPLISNVLGRVKTSSLDGRWQIIVDPYERGSYDYHSNPLKIGFETGNLFSDLKMLKVPGDWNTQKMELLYYEGVIWYRKCFFYDKGEQSRVFIHFGAINYMAEVYLNGLNLGSHIGGFTPFNFEVTKILKSGNNDLVIKVDNRPMSIGVPALMYDWWNFGGITRSVTLIETSSIFVRDYLICLDKKDKEIISGYVQLDGKDTKLSLRIEIPELKISNEITIDKNGYGEFNIKAEPEYWSVENPKLYTVKIVTKTDIVTDKIGFRTIETSGKKLFLNGKEIFLRGINIHAHLYGRSASLKEDAACMLGWAKDLGCNFVRLSHYPHSEEMIRLAEEMGIMVWEEIPVYWAMQWDNNNTYKNAESQLNAIIIRDKNRTNVIIWSIANETPIRKDRLKFLIRLANRTRKLDDQRLLGAALLPDEIEPNLWTITDELADIIDVIGFNQYVGWFNGTSDKCDSTEWILDKDKPYIMTEFGSSAPYGRHGAKTERYTEEYQEYYYQKTIEMIQRMVGLSGVCPWNLTEHRSPRLISPNVEDGYSRAGLISNKGQRKKAFFVMKKYYKKF